MLPALPISYDSRITYELHCESKRDLYTFAHNFGRFWWIFKIFPLLNSPTQIRQRLPKLWAKV